MALCLCQAITPGPERANGASEQPVVLNQAATAGYLWEINNQRQKETNNKRGFLGERVEF